MLKLLQFIFNWKKYQTQAITTNLDNNDFLLLFLLDLLDGGVQPLIEPDLKLRILLPTSILHQSINQSFAGKGNIIVISSDSQFKEGKVQITKSLHLKP